MRFINKCKQQNAWGGQISCLLLFNDFWIQPQTSWHKKVQQMFPVPFLQALLHHQLLSAPRCGWTEPGVDLLLLHCVHYEFTVLGHCKWVLPYCSCMVWKIKKLPLLSHPRIFPTTKPPHSSPIPWPSSPHTYAHSQSWGICCVIFLKMLSSGSRSLNNGSLCSVWISAHTLCLHLHSRIYSGSAMLPVVVKCWLAGWVLAAYDLKLWHTLHVRMAEAMLMESGGYSPQVKTVNITWRVCFVVRKPLWDVRQSWG